LHVLSVVGGVPMFGRLIDIGVLVRLFSGALARISASSRVLLLMAHNDLTHDTLCLTHPRHQTARRAIVLSGTAVLLPVVVLAAPALTALTSAAGWARSPCLAIFETRASSIPQRASLSTLAFLAMALALVGNVYSIPEGPYGKLPYVYLAYLAVGILWFVFRRSRRQE
jgi:hypothetical protein